MLDTQGRENRMEGELIIYYANVIKPQMKKNLES